MADLRYKVVVDDAEARNKLRELLSNTGVGTADGVDGKAVASINNTSAATTKLKEAQLANIESIRRLREERSKEIGELNILKQIEQEAKALLAEKKVATEDLTKAQKQANIEYQKSRKDLADHTLQLKKDAEERRKATEEERKAEKVLRDAEKARKDAERTEAKRQKDAEKRRKQLERESSEYYKLNKALGEVRKQAKDVLAEMFSLERRGYGTGAAYEALKQKSEALTKQTQFLDRGIKKIDATLGLHQREVGNYARAMEDISPIISNINQKLALFGTSIDQLATKPGAVKELGAAFVNMGKGLVTFLLSPVGLLITALGTLFMLFQRNKQTVIDFDSGLKNVSKTTNMAGKDLSLFGDAIVELSMKLQVVDATKLLEYATAAGQLGVRGKADILAFTEAMAMLETASNISGEEGASEIARMLTLVDGGVQNVKEFGDEIVNLGNNFAATEKEILANAEQIAQNVGIYKIGRQDVLAFATATKAVGLEAELVGSTFSRTLGTFEKTIRSGKGVGDVLKIIGGTQQDLQRRFRDDAAGVFRDYIRGLNNIQSAGGSVNEALERTGIVAVRDQRVLASLATNGYDVLTNAMDKVRNANGAMQAEFENGASKLENQTRRMGIAWDNFVLSIEKGEGVIANTILHLMNGFSILLDTINKTFNPTSVDEFWARWYSFEKADQIRDINKAMEDTEHQIAKISKFDTANASASELTDALKEVNSAIKTASAALATYKKQVNAGLLTEGGKSNFKDFEDALSFLRIRQANLMRLGANAKAAPAAPVFDESDKDRSKRERAQRASEQAAEKRRQAMENQRALQLQIDQVNEQALRSQLSRDQQEVASIRDKYAKIREEARKFEADPKNRGLRVDLGGLRRSENFEISEATTRQDTIKLVDQLNKQKAIYDEYNAYVQSTSVSQADALYKDQLDIVRDFKNRLKQEYMDIVTLEQTAAEGGFSGSTVKLTQAQEERAKTLSEMIDSLEKQEESQRRQRLAKALEDNRTYQEKIIDLENEFKKQYAELGEGITEDQKRILLERRQAEIDSLNETEAAKNAIIVKGAKQYLMVSTASIVAQIKVVKDLLAREDLSDEFRGQLNGRLNGLERSLRLGATAVNVATLKTKIKELRSELIRLSNTKGANPEEIRNVNQAIAETQEEIDVLANDKLSRLLDVIQQFSSSLSELGDSFTNLGDAFGNSTLSSVGGVLSGLANNLDNITVAFDRNATKTDKYAAAIQSLVSIISMVANASAERKRAEEEYYMAVIAMQREYNLSLNDQIRLQAQLEESVYVTDYVGRVQSGMLAAEDAIKGYQGAMAQLIKDGKISKGLESAVDWGKVGSGASSGAAIGATIGTIFPVIGNIVGAAVGAIVGGLIGLFGGKKKKPKYEEMYANLPKEIVDVLNSSEPRDLTEVKNLLQSMNNDKAVDANTKGMIEGVLEWIAKIEEARAQIKEVVVELSGQIGSELRNSLVEAFKAGEDAASAMGRTVNKVLEDVISNILFTQAFEKLFKDFEEDFTDALLIGDTAGIVDVFAGFLDKAGPATEQFYSWMDTFQKEAQKKGLDIFGNTSGSSSLGSEGIARQLTESTGTEIVGMYRAGYDIWKRQLITMELQSKTQISLLQMANDKLLVLNSINVNTANTVVELKLAVGELQKINKNLGGAYGRN